MSYHVPHLQLECSFHEDLKSFMILLIFSPVVLAHHGMLMHIIGATPALSVSHGLWKKNE